MKQKLTIVVIALVAMLIPSAVMAQQKEQRTDPDHARYSITGNMVYENGQRYLKAAVGKGIQFEYVPSRLARPTMAADLVVRFDSVETTHPNGITRLDFWRYDTEVGEWVYDSEVRQGENELETTMKTNIMLVIDNSKSLKDDFKKVQDAAIEFVGQLYRASEGRDVFRVGVIGFSTVQFTRTREITTLDAMNYREIVSFIRNLEMQNGTAFYYSLETALNMLESDAERIGEETYKESRIYAFTDGLDQASVDDARGLSNPTQFFDHIKPMMKGINRKKIMNLPKKKVHSTIVTVRGDDMTDKQERLFDQRAQEICDDVRKLDDMSKLVSEFKKLAADLVNSNYVLYCYIPVGASGRVGWTFAEEKMVVKTPTIKKVKEPSKFWMGVGVEAGNSYYYDYWYGGYYEDCFHFGLRADAAYPLCSWFAIGGTLSLGIITGDMDFAFRVGPLAKFTFSNGSALLAGAGIGTFSEWDEYLPYISLGWKFKSPWYITVSGNFDASFSFGVGYSIFGGKNK